MSITLKRNYPIEKVEIKNLYQPLYSVHEKRYVGVEALSRGIYNGKFLDAGSLFSCPADEAEKLFLNQKCIRSALRNLKDAAGAERLTVFLNIDSALMDNKGFSNLDFEIYPEAEAFGVDSGKIVIELIENRVKNFDILLDFVSYCRERGFLIALDDVGAAYSSLERIVKIKPDIIKIDRALVNGVSEEFHKKEVCRSLIGLSHNIGALSLAEGVETLNDALECQELGADIMQGFYFSKPVETIVPVNISSGRVALLVETCKLCAKERSRALGLSLTRLKRQAEGIYSALNLSVQEEWDYELTSGVETMPDVECAYIINSEGKQVSVTALRSNQEYKNHYLFAPAEPGTDHSQKYYFLRRTEGQKWFISDPYISGATGNICRTVSMLFKGGGDVFYLCLDINS